MKLWQKISLLTAAILLISMAVYGGITVYETTNYNLNQTRTTASRQVRTTAYALGQSLSNADTQEMSDTARKAYLQFLLRRYSCRDYMLLQDWELAANTTNYELTGNALKQFDTWEPVAAFQKRNGKHLMIVGQKIPVSDGSKGSYQLLLVRDISEIYNNVLTQIGMFLVFLGIIVAVAINAVFWIIRRMLKPLRDLRETAGAISQGQLTRRVRVRSNDEVGALSVSFNQMADQIEYQMEELEQVSERRKQLLGSLAHELKTPMTSIIGYADTLYQKTLPPEDVHQLAGIIMNEGMRLEALSFKLMELVTLSRSDFQLEEARIDEVMADAVETITPAAEKRKVQIKLQTEEAWVRLEYDLFKTLLLNLMDNALKSGTDVVFVQGSCENEQYKITITDRGRGIPTEDLEKITEAFYMVDKSRSRKEHGAGLGLALAVRIAQLHHTTLSYRSQPDQGTSVILVLQKETDDEEETD